MHSTEMVRTTDDQERVNYALFELNLTWSLIEQPYEYSGLGATEDGIRVATLPLKYACRKNCTLEFMSELVIWHQGGARSSPNAKVEQSLESQVWFLPRKFGAKYLQQLTTPGSLRNIRERLSPIAPTITISPYT